jgi:hypothetical protein
VPAGRRRLYDWDGWFAMGLFTLQHGTHYTCSQSAIVQQVRNAACERDMQVETVDEGNQVVVRVTSRAAM